MRKPIEAKTPLAAWATLSREQAGMSVEEVVDALGARGHSVRAATIRGIEGGSKGASVRLRRLLADVYGVTPPEQETAAPDTGTAALVAMFSAFLDELREDRRVRQEQIAELIQEMRVDRLARQEWERGYLEATLELVEAAKREADPPDEPLEAVSAQQARP